jgi:hypothetical protein
METLAKFVAAMKTENYLKKLIGLSLLSQVADMETLAKFVAAMKPLPSRGAMLDYHVDKNFNSTNPVSVWSRSIIYWGKYFSKVLDTVTLYIYYILEY